MSDIEPLATDAAPADVRLAYEEFGRRMGFLNTPNFIKTLGHSAAAARGTWAVVLNVLVSGKIPRWTKEMIFVAISRDRACLYCEAAHHAGCRMLGVSAEPWMASFTTSNRSPIRDFATWSSFLSSVRERHKALPPAITPGCASMVWTNPKSSSW